MTQYGMDSPVGGLLLTEEDGMLTGLELRGTVTGNTPPTPLLRETVKQLEAYFAGKRQVFALPLKLNGTSFQQEVWTALREIPFGMTTTYGEIANRIGRPRAVRAVGRAIGQNPISIIVPCHRVIGKNGNLTGFAWGLDAKRQLLMLEGHDF